MSFNGAEAQVSVIVHAVFAKVSAIAHNVEAGAHVAAMGYASGNFSSERQAIPL